MTDKSKIAFPRPAAHDIYGNPLNRAEFGMTMREYYAGQALAGIMANPERWKQIARDYRRGRKTYDECSKANTVKALSLADEMIFLLKTKQ